MDGDNSQQSPGTGGNWQFRPGDSSAPDNQQSEKTDNEPDSQLTDSNKVDHVEPYVDDTQPDDSDMQSSLNGPEEVVSWSAVEFIAHNKSVGWYTTLVLVTAAISALVFFVTKDKISTSIIIFVAIIFGITAARKPQTIGYKLDGSGLTIDQKFYDYDQFRSFAVVDERTLSSIVFMPMRRFMPLLTIYFDHDDEDKIVDLLADRMPMETHRLDLVDQLLRRIRF